MNANNKWLLTLASVYLGLFGLGLIIVPNEVEFDALANASAVVVSEFRQYGGALLGIALLNWLVRNDEPSKTKRAVFLGNTLGFSLVALGGIVRQLSGAPAIGWVFVVINICFVIAFGLASRSRAQQ